MEQISETLIHILHFRCLHLSHIYHKQKYPSGTTKYTLSEQRSVECFYTWAFVCLQNPYLIVIDNLEAVPSNEDLFPSNKVHIHRLLALSVTKRKLRKVQTCKT